MELNLLYPHTEAIGYGRYGVSLARAIEAVGCTTYDILPGPKEGMQHLQGQAGGQPGLDAAAEMGGAKEKVCNVVAWVSVPSHARGWWKDQIPIVSTMWESTYLPEAFREQLHEFDTVIVPSQQNVELFSQYHGNVKYVPLGMNSNEWKFQARKPPGQFFNFLIGGSGARKGTDLAYKAFLKVFPDGSWGDGPIPQLVMKNPKGEPDLCAERVVQITGKLEAEDEIGLYADAHCYLQPSRGEGFGLQPLQAIAQGCPTILTDAHGHASFAHLGYGLDTKLTTSEYFIYGDAGEWWEPDFDQLCEYMHHVYHHYEEATERARFASKAAHETFTWENCANNFLDAIGRERLTPYKGNVEWYIPTARLYPTMLTRDHKCEIGGVMRIFQRGVQYWEPADVKRILFEYGLLDPTCCQTQGGTDDVGLLPQQIQKMGLYEAKHSFCPTCEQKLNTQPTAWQEDMERRERDKNDDDPPDMTIP